MNDDLVNFYNEVRQLWLAEATTNNDFRRHEFTEFIAKELSESGEIDEFEPCFYQDEGSRKRVDGFWLDDDPDELILFVSDFSNRTDLDSLPMSDVIKIFNKLFRFFEFAILGKHTKLEETSPGYMLAEKIYDQRSSFNKVKMYLLSERALSSRVETIDNREEHGYAFSHHVWDISRLSRLADRKGAREKLVIRLRDDYKCNLQCLPAHLNSSGYESYLVVIPGNILSKIYEEHGSRLLEQNVRTFLQARNKVNKGIRSTLINEPEMFFAFNNGLTATATRVDSEKIGDSTFINAIEGFQIVNGGQTTASVFHTKRKDKASLDNVFVQMKLSVIGSENIEKIVPKISEYANTQNRVNAADFFSNHPFHVRMEEFSRRMWVDAQDGSQKESKWFYERARGQYIDSQSSMTPSEKKMFGIMHPRRQLFTKTDLAKYENVWSDHPEFVHLGAQKNFVKFAERIGKEWIKSPDLFNEFYYKRVISRAIIFRATERIVSAQDWYSGAFRANIVAYSLSLMSEICKNIEQDIDVMAIWKNQSIPTSYGNALAQISKFVNSRILNAHSGSYNITEWCKRKSCWEDLKTQFSFNGQKILDLIEHDLVSIDHNTDISQEASNIQKSDNKINAMIDVFNISPEQWRVIFDKGSKQKLFSPKEESIIRIALQMPNKIPSEKQFLVLGHVLKRALEEGIHFEGNNT